MAEISAAGASDEKSYDPTPQVPKHFWRGLFRLVLPFWVSEEKWWARGLLAATVSISLLMVYFNVILNDWYRRFFDALQTKNADAFWTEITFFIGIATIYVLVAVFNLYVKEMLRIRWRRWLVHRLMNDYFQARTYYRLASAGYATDNPDQRIQEDTNGFVTSALSLSLGLLSEVVTLVTFTSILWTLSSGMNLPWGDSEIDIPGGYMVWCAVLYAFVGTVLTFYIGRPLFRLRFNQEHVEANFRFGLMRVRENAEGIALYGGEAEEKRFLSDRFNDVYMNFRQLVIRLLKLNTMTVTYGQTSTVIPYLLLAPVYFTTAMTLGAVQQTVNAFNQVQGALSFLVNAFASYADWRAIANRLVTFQQAMDAVHADAADQPEITLADGAAGAVTTRGLALRLPDGRVLLRDADLDLKAGDRVLVRGASGSGKSTLFRALAGIWPLGGGTVQVPKGARVLFLPQRPYLPIGNLRNVVTYPALAGSYDDAAVRAVLEDVGLGHLATRLDDVDHWSMRLSGGEQQRLAIARALLYRPDWLFVDEGTSNLDAAGVDQAYRLLIERLPGLSIVSISHDDALVAAHTRVLELRGGQLVEQSARA
ncbi:ABC transporter ATP-binding protein/permease [Zavarzinia sp. CC-PAN008]|uniref:ABC transporter ATP-binding protein/permease n=1 Tax=Zavarzinia sp. CC-PAN008 TaxID=3243332 RepID=UPI003F743392